MILLNSFSNNCAFFSILIKLRLNYIYLLPQYSNTVNNGAKQKTSGHLICMKLACGRALPSNCPGEAVLTMYDAVSTPS